MIDLSGQVALVTGSSRGIGKACAIRLAEAGADVIVNYITSRSAAEDVAAQIQQLGRRTAIVKADVSEQEDVTALMDFVRDHVRATRHLGQQRGHRWVSLVADDHFATLRSRLRNQCAGVCCSSYKLRCRYWNAARDVPKLSRFPVRARSRAQAMYGLVGSTKAAMECMIRHLALEIGKRGVNLNVLRAGLVETDSFALMPDKEKLLTRQALPEHGGRATGATARGCRCFAVSCKSIERYGSGAYSGG